MGTTIDSCKHRMPVCPYEIYTVFDIQQDTIKYIDIDDKTGYQSIFKQPKALQVFRENIKHTRTLHPDLIRIIRSKKFDL